MASDDLIQKLREDHWDRAADEVERLRAEVTEVRRQLDAAKNVYPSIREAMAMVADRDAVIAEALAVLTAHEDKFGGWPQLGCDMHAILSRAPEGALERRLAEQREADARIVERLNADYRDHDGLDGQRGFSVEAAALIRGGDPRG